MSRGGGDLTTHRRKQKEGERRGERANELVAAALTNVATDQGYLFQKLLFVGKQIIYYNAYLDP
jgi:hypothetical protein